MEVIAAHVVRERLHFFTFAILLWILHDLQNSACVAALSVVFEVT